MRHGPTVRLELKAISRLPAHRALRLFSCHKGPSDTFLATNDVPGRFAHIHSTLHFVLVHGAMFVRATKCSSTHILSGPAQPVLSIVFA